MAIRFPSKNNNDKKRRALTQWMEEQRHAYRDGTLSQEQIEKLEMLPEWSWDQTYDTPGQEGAE